MFSKYKNISNASLSIFFKKNLYFYTYIKLSSGFYTFEVMKYIYIHEIYIYAWRKAWPS